MAEQITSLTTLESAARMLAEVRSVDDAKSLINRAEAARVYARQIGLGLEAQNHAAEIKLRAQRRAGELLREMDKRDGGDAMRARYQPVTEVPPTLADIGIDKMASSRWQAIASLPPEEFEEYIAETKEAGDELTTSGAVMAARQQAPHVTYNSGNNEWYTPPQFIEAARLVMGAIDLDPASSDFANGTVSAARYYTSADNGLTYEWEGRVWMNPPYGTELIGSFCSKLVEHVREGHIEQAVVLVNNATDTGWFQELLSAASAICLVRGRIRYLDRTGSPALSPLQGQAILYFGEETEAFTTVFAQFGGTSLWTR